MGILQNEIGLNSGTDIGIGEAPAYTSKREGATMIVANIEPMMVNFNICLDLDVTSDEACECIA